MPLQAAFFNPTTTLSLQELEQEALAHVKAENERLTLREELEFRKESFDTVSLDL